MSEEGATRVDGGVQWVETITKDLDPGLDPELTIRDSVDVDDLLTIPPRGPVEPAPVAVTDLPLLLDPGPKVATSFPQPDMTASDAASVSPIHRSSFTASSSRRSRSHAEQQAL